MSTPKPLSRRDAYRAYKEAGGVVFLMLQVAVKNGEVFKMRDMRQELASLGPLAGARADIAASLPRFGQSHPEGIVRFADGTSHTGLAIVGGGFMRKVRAEVVEFNTLARAATPPPAPPPASRVECVYCCTMNPADLDRCDHCGAPIRLSR